MKPLLLSELAAWTGGRLIGADLQIDRVSTDSRLVGVGTLFAALCGERVDGHDFVPQALAAGASAALVQRPLAADLPQLVVADVLLAIGHIAAGLRNGRSTTVLALTGSSGKTSVKTLLASMLAAHAPTHATAGSRNNELGMPLALIEQPEDAHYAVYEMGAGQPGDIDYLSRIARPQIALVNNIGPAHLQRMGSMLGIAETKGAIYSALPDEGTAVINADDAFGAWYATRVGSRRTLRFAIEASADVCARNWQPSATANRFVLCTPAGSADVQLPLPGRHNVANALASSAMALAAGVPLTTIVAQLHGASAVPGRLQSHQLADGSELIDDSYNANPASLAAAIAVLAARSGHRCLLLGDMLELGPEGPQLHAEAGRQARAAGLDAVWTVGALAAECSRAFGPGGQHFADQASMIAALRSELAADRHYLVKGSHGSRMDRVVDALLGREAAHAA